MNSLQKEGAAVNAGLLSEEDAADAHGCQCRPRGLPAQGFLGEGPPFGLGVLRLARAVAFRQRCRDQHREGLWSSRPRSPPSYERTSPCHVRQAGRCVSTVSEWRRIRQVTAADRSGPFSLDACALLCLPGRWRARAVLRSWLRQSWAVAGPAVPGAMRSPKSMAGEWGGRARQMTPTSCHLATRNVCRMDKDVL